MKQVTVHDSTLTLAAGDYPVADGAIELRKPATFKIDPADVDLIKDEPLQLSAAKPEAFYSGTRLKAIDARDINAMGAFTSGSLTIRRAPDGPALAEGKDYLVAPEFGMVGLGPQTDVTTTTTVYASYQAARLRLDSIVVDQHGQAHLLRGKPDTVVPAAPAVPEEMHRLMNIFRPYRATALTVEDLFPILETAAQAQTASKAGLVPRTLARLKAGQPVHIVCWGDSVTAGGNASDPAHRYVNQFERLLHEKFPTTPLKVQNISVGGSNSVQWTRSGPFKDIDKNPNPGFALDQVNFQRVLDAKPDLVTIEFVNDAGYDKALLQENYSRILESLRGLGAEVILITPHFTAVPWMNATDVRTPETRPYVQFVDEFAKANNLAVADASARWAHLWREGIPYVTLLDNSVNHPNDYGHLLFAEELMKCFGE